MRTLLLQKKFQVGFLALVLIGIISFDIGGIFRPIRSFFATFTQPIALLGTNAGQAIRHNFVLFGTFSDVRETNKKLFTENRILEARVAELETMASENEQLRKELGLTQKTKKELETAEIIGYGGSGGSEWILINKGKNSGFIPNMPVLAHSSVLIGRIEELYAYSSRVRLLSDGESVVNVMIADTRTKGILRGRYGLGLQLDMVLPSETLNEGDRVLTSNLSEKYPSDLFVGTVKDIVLSEDGLSQQAVIDQGVNIFELTLVSVLLE